MHLAQESRRGLKPQCSGREWARPGSATMTTDRNVPRHWIPLLVALLAAACGSSGSTDAARRLRARRGRGADDADRRSPARSTTPPTAFPTASLSTCVPTTWAATPSTTSSTRSQSFELCSDDLVEAQAWEDCGQCVARRQRLLRDVDRDARYFEIVRELAYDNDVGNINSPTTPGFGRVFKCEHTNPRRRGPQRC